MDSYFWLLSLLDSMLRLATPLLLAALAGFFSERAGVVDIGLEGKMLMAAFAAAATAAATGSAGLGLLAAIGASLLLALLHGFACITHRGNQVVSGVALNITAMGLTAVLGNAWFEMGGRTPNLPATARFGELTLPLAETLRGIPVLGSFYSEVVSGHNILVYLALALVPLTAWVAYRTRFGLRLRAVGENPAAVDTAGISVPALRYQAVLIAGLLCGLAGAYLSTAQGAGFQTNMTAGKGYLALAALILGKWKPVPTLLACLLFAAADALQTRLQGVVMPGLGEVPVQLIEALPYLLTVLLLAGFMGKAIPPKASGRPYVKER
ncbi:ABC transporter permease [Niveispirillum sp. SYP-B3756]|uniref:ABC transporter permease n=1 Tax=Niveispirillum sp. SYP-B3756 TaxID=2662178 RepID=UPI0012926268|nr:ABC transporter permease [Niveispirillum sp. SYP-B3756]MQP68501.1 ABC transporter permease [Niveispirillum sp. SYP-B3756]